MIVAFAACASGACQLAAHHSAAPSMVTSTTVSCSIFRARCSLVDSHGVVTGPDRERRVALSVHFGLRVLFEMSRWLHIMAAVLPPTASANVRRDSARRLPMPQEQTGVWISRPVCATGQSLCSSSAPSI